MSESSPSDGHDLSTTPLGRATPDGDAIPTNDPFASPPSTSVEAGSPATVRRKPTGSDELGPGAVIGNYRIVRELGRGGQATVFLADDLPLQRQVALKVLTASGRGDVPAAGRFRREAMATSALRHPGICAVFEAQLDAPEPHIAMQYIEGRTLAQCITEERARRDPTTRSEHFRFDTEGTSADPPQSASSGTTTTATLDHDEILRIVKTFESAAAALQAAHDAGVIHRDVKPANIMIVPNGDAVILDFGLSRQEESGDPTLTKAGDLFGTPAYMSPEQLTRHSIALDARSDVWSLGVSLYEALAMQRPFEAPTRQALFQAILMKEPTPLHSRNPAIPRDLEVVVMTALEKDRDRRYQSMRNLAEDLRRVREGLPISVRPLGPVGRILRWTRREPIVASLAFLLFAVLVIGLGIALLLLAERETALSEARSASRSLVAEVAAKETALREAHRLTEDKEREARQAESLRLCATSVGALREDPALALLLAAEAAKIQASEEADSAAAAAVDLIAELETIVLGGSLELGRDPEGRVFAVRHDRSTLSVIDLASRRVLLRGPASDPEGLPPVFLPSVAPDGQSLATSIGRTSRILRAGAPELRLDANVLTPRPFSATAFDHAGRLFVFPTQDGIARLDVTSGEVAVRPTPEVERGARVVLAGRMGALLSAFDGPMTFVPFDPNEAPRPLDSSSGHHAQGAMWSPDGLRVVAPNESAGATLWEIPSGKLIARLGGSSPRRFAATFTRDSSRLATGDGSGAVIVWTRNGELVERIDVRSREIQDLDFEDSGTLLAIATKEDGVFVYDFTVGRPRLALPLRGDAPARVRFDVNGDLFSTDGLGHVRRSRIEPLPIDPATSRAIEATVAASVGAGSPPGLPPGLAEAPMFRAVPKRLPLLMDAHRRRAVAVSGDGAWFRVVNLSGNAAPLSVVEYDGRVGAEDRSSHAAPGVGPGYPIRASFAAADDALIVNTGVALVIPGKDGRGLALDLAKEGETPIAHALSSDGQRVTALMASDAVGTPILRIWDCSSRKIVATRDDLSNVAIHGPHAFSPDLAFAVCTADSRPVLVPTDPARPIVRLRLPFFGSDLAHGTSALAVSPDGRAVAAGFHEGDIAIWRVGDEQSPVNPGRLKEPVANLRWIDDTKVVGVGSRSLIVVGVRGEEGPRVREIEDDIVDIAIDAGRTRIAALCRNGAIPVWELASGRRLVTLRCTRPARLGLAFSPDANVLLVACADGLVARRIAEARILADPPPRSFFPHELERSLTVVSGVTSRLRELRRPETDAAARLRAISAATGEDPRVAACLAQQLEFFEDDAQELLTAAWRILDRDAARPEDLEAAVQMARRASAVSPLDPTAVAMEAEAAIRLRDVHRGRRLLEDARRGRTPTSALGRLGDRFQDLWLLGLEGRRDDAAKGLDVLAAELAERKAREPSTDSFDTVVPSELEKARVRRLERAARAEAAAR